MKYKKYKQHKKFTLCTLWMLLILCFLCGKKTQAAVSTTEALQTGTTEIEEEPYYVEPESSDLSLIQAKTILDSPRWIQSFTKDGRYYYFVQMTNPDAGNLRITRVWYIGPGRYLKDHMDLKGFGHGTNIDCSVYNGRTYLWIGSCMNKKTKRTEAISCFAYKKNAVYTKKAGYTYSIRMKGKLKKATNVFPAVSSDGKYLFVRYTDNNKQYFQQYNLYGGIKIDTNRILMKCETSATIGDFQGFDAHKNNIYTIEGSPTALFLSTYDSSRVFRPTVIRVINFKSKTKSARVIRGGKGLTFREPEGIKVNSKGKMEIMFVSNTLTKQYCNLFSVK